MSSVKRTYGRSRSIKTAIPSSPVSDLRSSSPPPTPERANRPSRVALKRPLEASESDNALPSDAKRPRLSAKPIKPASKRKSKTKLTQLHLVPDQPLLRTCPQCALSYIKGAADDEILHRSHCARVRRGMEWGKEEERQLGSVGKEVVSRVKLKDGSVGRIVYFRADAMGKIGSKLTTLLETINLNLSAPSLTPEILRKSKAYLFLLSTPASKSPTSSSREKIVACIIAQDIESAMRIATSEECAQACIPSEDATSEPFSSPKHALVTIDFPDGHSGDKGLFSHPELLPTPLGISRIFVASTHRRHGIASALLDSVVNTFIHGYVLSPQRGEVAFTQPTGDGGALMRSWGGGGVRVYDECA